MLFVHYEYPVVSEIKVRLGDLRNPQERHSLYESSEPRSLP